MVVSGKSLWACSNNSDAKKTIAAMALVKDLRENYGIFCSIVVYPVIPKGLILLRLIPTATHSLEDVDITLKAFSGIREKLENGTYKRLSELVSASE